MFFIDSNVDALVFFIGPDSMLMLFEVHSAEACGREVKTCK